MTLPHTGTIIQASGLVFLRASRAKRTIESKIDLEKHLKVNLSQQQRSNKKNRGAKVPSARLAKILNLLATTLTICLCKAKEHVAKSWEITQKIIMR